jgi:hypothetical protein
VTTGFLLLSTLNQFTSFRIQHRDILVTWMPVTTDNVFHGSAPLFGSLGRNNSSLTRRQEPTPLSNQNNMSNPHDVPPSGGMSVGGVTDKQTSARFAVSLSTPSCVRAEWKLGYTDQIIYYTVSN